jgi:hypothetical protein
MKLRKLEVRDEMKSSTTSKTVRAAFVPTANAFSPSPSHAGRGLQAGKISARLAC